MSDPVSDKGLEGQEGHIVEKKEYVKPNIEEGAEIVTATAQAFTPAVLSLDA